jgi:outer membrane protease
MITITNNLLLPNGVNATYFIISAMNISTAKITVNIDGFLDKDAAEKALEKKSILSQQSHLADDFQIENAKTLSGTMTDDIRQKLLDIQTQMNTLAQQASVLPDYDQIKLISLEYIISYSDKIDANYVISELNKIDSFKNATLNEKEDK